MRIQRAKLPLVEANLSALFKAGTISKAQFAAGMANVTKEYTTHRRMEIHRLKREITLRLARNEINSDQAVREWHKLDNEISPCYLCRIGKCQWGSSTEKDSSKQTQH